MQPVALVVAIVASLAVLPLISANHSYLDAARSKKRTLDQPSFGSSPPADSPWLRAARSNLGPLNGPSPIPEAIRAGPGPVSAKRTRYDTQPYSTPSSPNRKDGCSTNYSFDYLLLTLEWGPGFCSTSPQKCIRKPENKAFTIHGLWPQLNQGQMEGFCCFDNTFVISELDRLVPDMKRLWFSYYGSDEKFWAHEWLKHGTCSYKVASLRGEQAFFGTTLSLKRALPLLDTLKKDGIVPGDVLPGKLYSYSEIINSLKRITGGKKVNVNCDKEHNQPLPVLTGIGVCYDKNFAFIDCPYTVTRCKDRMYFRNQHSALG